MNAVEILRQAQGTPLTNRRGKSFELKLFPAMTDNQIAELEMRLRRPLPREFRELVSFTSGFETPFTDCMEGVDLGSFEFGMEDILPQALPLSHDGSGNFWVIDLLSESRDDTAVFYACHDPPVLTFQAGSIAEFIAQVLRLGKEPWTSEIEQVAADDGGIWVDNPGINLWSECLNLDADMKAFAQSLDDSYLFIDLRNPRIGQGFSWGRYGADTVCKRFGEKRIFAYQMKKLTWFQKLFGV